MYRTVSRVSPFLRPRRDSFTKGLSASYRGAKEANPGSFSGSSKASEGFSDGQTGVLKALSKSPQDEIVGYEGSG